MLVEGVSRRVCNFLPVFFVCALCLCVCAAYLTHATLGCVCSHRARARALAQIRSTRSDSVSTPYGIIHSFDLKEGM